MKSISSINIQPLQKIWFKSSIDKMCVRCNKFKSSILKVRWPIAMHYYYLSPVTLNTLGNIPSKDSVRNATACTAPLTQVSHRSHNARTANRHQHSKGEKNGTQRLALVEPWCKHWSCSSWQKSTSLEEATLISEEIEPVVVAIIKLYLSGGS